MGDFADIKRKKMRAILFWLETKNGITIKEHGGCHPFIITHISWKRPFPIPFKNAVVNKHIIKALMKLLINSGVCTEEEFRNQLK